MGNFTAFTDIGDILSAAGAFAENRSEMCAVFDLYFKTLPSQYGYVCVLGLEDICRYIENIHFDDGDIEALRAIGVEDEAFFGYLSSFKFTGDIYAVPEGTVMFRTEPFLTVCAPIVEAELIRTALINIAESASFTATVFSRLSQAAQDKKIAEFVGSARCDVSCSRAAYIGGSDATSSVTASQLYQIQSIGYMPYSRVQAFECEYEAFFRCLRHAKGEVCLAVDTYDTIGSGIDAACEALRDMVERNMGKRVKPSVSLSTGDFAKLATVARKKLDEAELYEVGITVLGAFDEKGISSLEKSNAPIDMYGITSVCDMNNVRAEFKVDYCLTAISEHGDMKPKIKLGENIGDVTLPGLKEIYRYCDRNGKLVADEISVKGEKLLAPSHTIFDPTDPNKRKKLYGCSVRKLFVPIFLSGKRVYDLPRASDVKKYCEKEKMTLVSGVKRLDDPELVPVDLSEELWIMRRRMIGQRRSEFFLR